MKDHAELLKDQENLVVKLRGEVIDAQKEVSAGVQRRNLADISQAQFDELKVAVDLAYSRLQQAKSDLRAMKQSKSHLCHIVKDVPGLTIGYIGNYENWGDDTCWYIWVDDLYTENGNHQNIWSCAGKSFDKHAFFKAVQALNTYRVGWDAAQAAAKKKD